MNALKLSAFVFAAAFGCTALAQTPGKTRSEVKAETRVAIRAGETTAPGDSGKTLREASPARYEPRQATRKAKRQKAS